MKRRLLLLSPLAMLARLRAQKRAPLPWDPADLWIKHVRIDFDGTGAISLLVDFWNGDNGHKASVKFRDGRALRLWVDQEERDITPDLEEWIGRTVATIQQQITTRRAG